MSAGPISFFSLRWATSRVWMSCERLRVEVEGFLHAHELAVGEEEEEELVLLRALDAELGPAPPPPRAGPPPLAGIRPPRRPPRAAAPVRGEWRARSGAPDRARSAPRPRPRAWRGAGRTLSPGRCRRGCEALPARCRRAADSPRGRPRAARGWRRGADRWQRGGDRRHDPPPRWRPRAGSSSSERAQPLRAEGRAREQIRQARARGARLLEMLLHHLGGRAGGEEVQVGAEGRRGLSLEARRRDVQHRPAADGDDGRVGADHVAVARQRHHRRLEPEAPVGGLSLRRAPPGPPGGRAPSPPACPRGSGRARASSAAAARRRAAPRCASIAAVASRAPAGATTSPRSTAARSTPCRFTAVRCPAATPSTPWPCTWSPRTFDWMPRG